MRRPAFAACVALSGALASALLAAGARWLDPAWRYRQAIVIANPNRGPLPEHQLRFELPFQEGMRRKMQDVRFTAGDGVTPLGFWVEEVAPEEKTVVWLRLEDVPAGRAGSPGQARTYCYFGNRAAEAAGEFDAAFRKLMVSADTVGLWHCDEGRGDILHDASPQGHDLQAAGGEVGWGHGDGGQWGERAGVNFRRGSYLTLPGDGETRKPYLTMGGAKELCLTAFTWEVWVRLERSFPEARDNFPLIRKGSGLCYLIVNPQRRPGVWLSGGMQHTLVTPFGVPALTVGRWHHLAVSFDPDTLRLCLYQDAVCVARQTLDGRPESNDAPLTVGGYLGLTFPGSLDELRLSARALTPREIEADFRRCAAGPDTPLQVELETHTEQSEGR